MQLAEMLSEKGEDLDMSLEDQLCQALVEQEKLKAEDLNKAEKIYQDSDGSLPALLVRLGLLSEKDLASAIASRFEIDWIQNKAFPSEALADIEIPYRFMRENHLFPIQVESGTVVVVMAEPYNAYLLKSLSMMLKMPVKSAVGVLSEIDSALEKLYGGGRSAMGEIVDNLDGTGEGEDDVEHLRDLASEAPVIRLVNLVMQRAVESMASDIHIEPFENHLKVRYRIDGVLQEVESPPASSTSAVISRIKIMAKLNIAERRLPQDGRIMMRVQGKELDLRVSTVPTAHGESVVMRILDRDSIVFDFQRLGFTDHVLSRFKKELEKPHGIILVTGPTGSGKTTTLYTALQMLNTPERKIITVEDPVEYQLEGVNQIQAKSSIGLDFVNALRAIVRQDPDVIMIGEIRDLETARIAIQSALTGHLVLSTIHTNDAASGLTRLLDMGVDDYLLTSTINAILAQRLVRKLDTDSAEAYEALPEMVEELELERFTEERPVKLFHPQASERAPNGYSGRSTILECLTMSDSIRRLVMKHATSGEISAQAQKEGMLTMYEDGLEKSVQGLTTVEEVLRVTQES